MLFKGIMKISCLSIYKVSEIKIRYDVEINAKKSDILN